MSRGPATDEYATGQNKLECRTCPYQFAIERRYYERKEMKRKEVEDVMGGKDAWANVDKTDGEFRPCGPLSNKLVNSLSTVSSVPISTQK